MDQPGTDNDRKRVGAGILDTIDRALTSAGLGGPLGPAAGIAATVRHALSTAGLMSPDHPGTGTGNGVPTIDGRAGAPEVARPVANPSSHVFTNAAGSRLYRVFRPPGAPAGRLPVIVMLHGCTQSAEDFAVGTGMDRLAALHGFIAVYPEQPPGANPSKCWNWFTDENQSRDRGEPSLIAGLTREVIEREGGDPARVFVAGLSAGGAMAVIMAETWPDLYAAAGVHSGLPYASAHDVASAFAAMRSGQAARFVPRPDARAVPVIVFHGDSDPTVHPSNGLEIVARAGRAHAACPDAPLLRPVTSHGTAGGGRRYTRTVHAADGAPGPIEAWTLHGGGHEWSGGDRLGSHVDASGPDASAEMVRFFLSLRQE